MRRTEEAMAPAKHHPPTRPAPGKAYIVRDPGGKRPAAPPGPPTQKPEKREPKKP